MVNPKEEGSFTLIVPNKEGPYPYVCTFPGHWVVMKGMHVVAEDLQDVPSMLAKIKPTLVKEWKMTDFQDLQTDKNNEQIVMRGMQAYMKARCNQCHVIAGHGVNLGCRREEDSGEIFR